jgi:hypothetical protein
VDGYLTTRGDAVADTYRMIEEAGFEVAGNAQWRRNQQEDGTRYRVPGGGALLKPEVTGDASG